MVGVQQHVCDVFDKEIVAPQVCVEVLAVLLVCYVTLLCCWHTLVQDGSLGSNAGRLARETQCCVVTEVLALLQSCWCIGRVSWEQQQGLPGQHSGIPDTTELHP
ncbi:hypothetical protein O3P69_017591 [Scylla paramamosain]|uniref:Uncharacterized protein n=1 Tax=Scylla paramamosain TaxID=85552 RepID=A0AAW0TXS0_SCYPA